MSDRQLTKRIFDIMSVIILLSVIWPLILLIMLFVYAFSGRPVFFLQERLGINGKIFNIIKFRTMISGAQEKGKGIFIDKADNRITGIGKILRRLSLDELPQLFNVMKGDMSVIGPRPPLTVYPYKYDEYPVQFAERFSVEPGLTGYAQISGRNELTWDERFVYDIIYVEQQSFWFDIVILLRSIAVTVSGNNIY